MGRTEERRYTAAKRKLLYSTITVSSPMEMLNCNNAAYYTPAPIGWRQALSDDARLTYVAYIEPKSRTERPRKTKIGTEVAHVTRDSDTTFKIKRSKVNLQGAGAYCGGLPHSLFELSSFQLRDSCGQPHRDQ